MSDYISREAAVESIASALMQMDDPDAPRRTVEDYMPLAESMIRGVPTADVRENVRGEWIESDTDGFVCSVCRNGYKCQPTLMGEPMFEYCPVCGADMRGSDDD